MVKSELIHKTWKKLQHPAAKKDVEHIINTFIAAISEELKHDSKIKIEGFGTFSSYVRQAYIGKSVNHGTTETIDRKSTRLNSSHA